MYIKSKMLFIITITKKKPKSKKRITCSLSHKAINSTLRDMCHITNTHTKKKTTFTHNNHEARLRNHITFVVFIVDIFFIMHVPFQKHISHTHIGKQKRRRRRKIHILKERNDERWNPHSHMGINALFLCARWFSIRCSAFNYDTFEALFWFSSLVKHSHSHSHLQPRSALNNCHILCINSWPRNSPQHQHFTPCVYFTLISFWYRFSLSFSHFITSILAIRH